MWKPKLEIVRFEADDLIATSGIGDETPEDPFKSVAIPANTLDVTDNLDVTVFEGNPVVLDDSVVSLDLSEDELEP